MSVKEALLRLVAESEHRGMRALSTALLAELGGVGPMLLQNLAAAAEVLARLGVAAADGDASQGAAKRAKKEAGAAPAAVAPAEQRAAEEVEAAWALVSALAQALRQQADKEAAEGPDATTTGSSAEALAVLEEHLATLCFDWGAVGPSLGRHQAYVLARVAPLLAPRLGESEAAELRAALERVQGGGGAGEGAAGRE